MRKIKSERKNKAIFKNRTFHSVLEEFRKNNLYPPFRFIIKFNLLAAPLYVMLLTQWQSSFLIAATHNIVFSVLVAAGLNPISYGDVIAVSIKNGSWGAVINWDCVGWKSLLALFALIFATELPLKTKIKGFLLLAPLIYFVNVIRIWFIFWYIVNYDISNFAFVHAVVWSWGLITAVAVAWLVWLRQNYALKI